MFLMSEKLIAKTGFGGQVFFERLPEGVRLNAAGERLIAAAEDAERAMLTVERQRTAASPTLSGTVRVATGECAGGFLARCLSGPTREALPAGITLELVDELRQRANLVRHQAGMALRHEPPESGDFYVARLGTFAVAGGCTGPRRHLKASLQAGTRTPAYSIATASI
jgi:DNA-binding transcriptional LysR family regulator